MQSERTVSSLQILQSWEPPMAAVKRPKRRHSKPPPMANIVEGNDVTDALVAPKDGISRFLHVAI